MELKGQVILDDETVEELKSQIRKEVISEIKKEGNYTNEIIEFMNDCDYKGYMWLIIHTIDNIIAKTNEAEDVRFSSDCRIYHELLAIKSILII